MLLTPGQLDRLEGLPFGVRRNLSAGRPKKFRSRAVPHEPDDRLDARRVRREVRVAAVSEEQVLA